MTIAAFLNPHQLYQAAQVSKLWKKIFTSDTAWAHYDARGIGKGIYKDYLTTEKDCHKPDWTCRWLKGQYDINNTRPPSPYQLLARLRGCPNFQTLLVDFDVVAPGFYELIASRPITSLLRFDRMPPAIQQNKELVQDLLRAGAHSGGLNEENGNDRALFLSCRRRKMFWRDERAGGFSTKLLEDRELALHAVSSFSGVYHHLPENLKTDRELFLAWATNPGCNYPFCGAPQQFVNDRSLVLEVFSRRAPTCEAPGFPEAFDDDWEVVSASFKRPYELKLVAWLYTYPKTLLTDKGRLLQILKFGWLIALDKLPLELRLDEEVLQFYLDAIDMKRLHAHDPLLKRIYCLKPYCRKLNYDLAKRVLELEAPEIDCFTTWQEKGEFIAQKLGLEL